MGSTTGTWNDTPGADLPVGRPANIKSTLEGVDKECWYNVVVLYCCTCLILTYLVVGAERSGCVDIVHGWACPSVGGVPHPARHYSGCSLPTVHSDLNSCRLVVTVDTNELGKTWQHYLAMGMFNDSISNGNNAMAPSLMATLLGLWSRLGHSNFSGLVGFTDVITGWN